jgi:hypothetical protein
VSVRSELAAVPIPRDGPVTGGLIVRALHILTAGLIIRHCTSVEPTYPKKVIAEHCRPLENHISTSACGVAILSIVRRYKLTRYIFF